jgi:hypothetical protein
MLGIVKTTLDEDGKMVEFVSAEKVVESDMIMGKKKEKEKKTLVYRWL